jgi:hypothetical protein
MSQWQTQNPLVFQCMTKPDGGYMRHGCGKGLATIGGDSDVWHFVGCVLHDP